MILSKLPSLCRGDKLTVVLAHTARSRCRPCNTSCLRSVPAAAGRSARQKAATCLGLLSPLVSYSCVLTIRPDLTYTSTKNPASKLVTSSESLTAKILRLLDNVRYTIGILFRSFVVGLIFLPSLLSSPIILFRPGFEVWLDIFTACCETAGPIFVKLVQWASTRRDIFSELICDKFSRLQRNTKPHSWASTRAIIEDAYGMPFDEVFTSLESTPVGSGCCAQVYRGTVYEDGQEVEVAVKVLHPEMAYRLKQDLRVMSSLAKFVTWLFPSLQWLSLESAVHEFGILMSGQVNLIEEMNNLNTFRENFKNEEKIIFPRPLPSLCRQSVLVETWVHGDSIAEYMKEDTPLAVRQELGKLGVDMILKMVFIDNHWHGDLHPGNIIVTHTTKGPALTVLDAGISANLSKDDRRNLVDTFGAIVRGEGAIVGQLFLERSIHDCTDKETFVREINELVMSARGTQLTLNRVDISQLMQNLFGTLTRHRVRLDASFSAVVMAVMVLEGLGRHLDPHLDLVKRAAPYIARA